MLSLRTAFAWGRFEPAERPKLSRTKQKPLCRRKEGPTSARPQGSKQEGGMSKIMPRPSSPRKLNSLHTSIAERTFTSSPKSTDRETLCTPPPNAQRLHYRHSSPCLPPPITARVTDSTSRQAVPKCRRTRLRRRQSKHRLSKKEGKT